MSKGEWKTVRPCEICGKTVNEGDEFVLVGKYPSHGKVWVHSTYGGYSPPEKYGLLYHKSCFLEILKKKLKEGKC